MTRIRWMLIFLLALALPAHADDVVYPPGSRVGLVPPPQLHASASFPGFEDRDKNVALLLGALPPGGICGIREIGQRRGLEEAGRHAGETRIADAAERQGACW